MISLGLALEKTGAAEALAHAIVNSFQWAGAISIFLLCWRSRLH
jgi:di/tricarboxylate transporter